ncbi:MAG: putative glycosyl transferase [Tardiphaga sp.]|nr:putative glycosyl transferase [Tardiphaga sp.]MDB5626235.1 putative glycosyl transferase [Tardiphaga sp.]
MGLARPLTTVNGAGGSKRDWLRSDRVSLIVAVCVVVVMTLMRCIYAGEMELRTDEAYYWTWSKESVLSFLDHPPMIAWFIRFGTAIFGDTPFGVRFAGLLAMLVSQVLLADIVRRTTRDGRAVAMVLLLPEAALYYGLLMAKVAPDVALIPFALALIYALVRLVESDDGRWWLAAGVFAGLALLSKLTALMLLPAVAAFVAMPSQRRWLLTPWPWLAMLLAVMVFSPVLVWNAQHDWASFKFQFIRASADHPLSIRTLGDFLGLQFGQVGIILLPVVISAVSLSAWRGVARRDPIAMLLAVAVAVPFAYFLWKSLTLRVGDTWPMFLWPAGFAAVAINWARLRQENWSRWIVRSTGGWIVAAIVTGIPLVLIVFLYSVASPWNLIGRNDPIGAEAGYDAVAAQVEADMALTGATWVATMDYRTYAMLRWTLRDRVPVIQVNQRSRFIGFRDPGLAARQGDKGLCVARDGETANPDWAFTTARITPVGRVERRWRGTLMDTHETCLVSGWTPQLNPPPTSPLYRWPDLAGLSPVLVARAD